MLIRLLERAVISASHQLVLREQANSVKRDLQLVPLVFLSDSRALSLRAGWKPVQPSVSPRMSVGIRRESCCRRTPLRTMSTTIREILRANSAGSV